MKREKIKTPAETTYIKVLGRRIRNARDKKRIDQTKFAGWLSLSTQSLYLYERGIRPLPIEKIPELCRILGITQAALLANPTKEEAASVEIEPGEIVPKRNGRLVKTE